MLDWGDDFPVLKTLKFFVEWADFSEAFLFPSNLQIKYFSRVYSKFVLSLVCLFFLGILADRPGDVRMGKDSHR